MKRVRNLLILHGLLCTALWPAQQTQTTAAETSTAKAQPPAAGKAGANEVLLDVIVRDRKGKPVKDLSATDFKVSEDGVEQTILSARLVDGAEAVENGARVPLDAMRRIRLVTLVFEPLSDAGRRIAREAALNLLKIEPAQNVLYSVVAITTQLSVLQAFTSDGNQLKKAIERATSGKPLSFPAESEKIKAELKAVAGRGGADAVARRTAEIMLSMLSFDASYSRDESARMSIFALLSLIRGQSSLAGRKSIVYFSEGMELPTNLDEPFNSITSTANRGNVTLYSVDARGVMTESQNRGATDELNAANDNIRRDTTSGAATAARQGAPANPAQDSASSDGRVSKEQIRAADTAESSGRKNVQLPLRTLAESTGGFLIGETNDLRPALRKVLEDANSYYEISYDPGTASCDGRFRKTRVRVTRRDTTVQDREGYFALPASARGLALLPYEFTLLQALDSVPAPAEVEFRSAALKFKPARDGAKAMVVVEVPMSAIQFSENLAARTFRMRVSTVALIKDEKGEVVQKLTNDLPRSGPLAMLQQARAGNFVYKEQVQVPPGRYTLETAVMDRESNKIGVRKSPFVVDALPTGVGLSSLCLVRSYQPNAKDLDPNDPLQYQGGRIAPTLSGQIFAAPGAQLSTFFIVYPDPALKAAPTAKIEFLVGGSTVANLDLPLPAADAQGRIPFVMSAPVANMPPATYDIHVTVKQGSSTAEERMKVIVGEVAK